MNSDFALNDLYSILEISSSADKITIKTAFRRLAKKYHPDINKGDKNSEQKFKKITMAYEILSDEVKRKDYDKKHGFFKEDINKNTYFKTPTKKSNSSASFKKKKNTEKTFSKTFSNFINDFFTYSQEPSKKPVDGSDIFMNLTITMQEAINGGTRNANILHTEPCPICNGKKFLNDSKCKKCMGTGEISSYKVVVVKIHPLTVQNEEIIIQNEGNQGQYGGKNGNLILKIHIEKNEFFRFENLNVLSDIPISPTEAALGTTINIPTINGTINMKIPPETSSGQKFRLHELGIYDPKTNQHGDQIVTVFIKIPKNLSLKEKALYNKLAQLREFNPRNENYND